MGPRINQEDSLVKVCTNCNVELIPGVNIHHSQWNVKSYKCKECKRAYQRKLYPEYYANNFEKHMARIIKLKHSINPSIYFIFNKRTKELLWIGQSKLAYERIYGQHFSKNSSSPISQLISSGEVKRGDLDFFIYKEEEDCEKRKKLEAKLIKQLQPKLNTKWK